MLTSIWDDVKREFGYGNMVTRIIIVNVVLFVGLNMLLLLLKIGNEWQVPELYNSIRNFFCVSSDWVHNLTHPWVFISSTFLHEGFWHILWNMLFLYWFGRIVGDFIGNHRVLPIYLLGGVVGALTFFITANFIPYVPAGEPAYALGASAGVMAIVVASATISPDYIMRLLFLGDVRLKYIVGVLVMLDIIGLGSDHNTGGHFAHIGGAFFGYLFVSQLQNGNDLSEPVNNLMDKLKSLFGGTPTSNTSSSPKKRKRSSVFSNVGRTMKGGQSSDTDPMNFQEKLDSILDKIKKDGYESLSEAEKDFLNNASKK